VNIANPVVRQIDAFNAFGIHCGRASWSVSGGWLARTETEYKYADSQEQAEAWLRERGAVTIEERT
jgi:hypothetical protein